MKKITFTFILILTTLMTPACAEEDSKFTTLIEKVPITNLSIGTPGLDGVDSIYHHKSKWTEMETLVDWDINNKYKLNNLFTYDEPNLLNKSFINSSLSILNEVIDTMYFCKRLQPLGDNEVLIYYTRRYNPRDGEAPVWMLLVVNKEGVVQQSLILGGLDCMELDTRAKVLFYIDANYNLTTYGYSDNAYEGNDTPYFFFILKEQYKSNGNTFSLVPQK